VTIVELQRLFFEDARRFVTEALRGVVARADEIVSHWDTCSTRWNGAITTRWRRSSIGH